MVLKYKKVNRESDEWGYLDNILHVNVRKLTEEEVNKSHLGDEDWLFNLKFDTDSKLSELSPVFPKWYDDTNPFGGLAIYLVEIRDSMADFDVEPPHLSSIKMIECLRNNSFITLFSTEICYLLDDNGKTIERI